MTLQKARTLQAVMTVLLIVMIGSGGFYAAYCGMSHDLERPMSHIEIVTKDGHKFAVLRNRNGAGVGITYIGEAQ